MKIHTFEIQARLSHSECARCSEVFFHEAREKQYVCYRVENCVYCNKWKDEGVRIIMEEIVGTGYGGYLTLRINPSQLISQDYDALHLFGVSEKSLDVLLENISFVIHALPIVKDVREFTLHRFDLCTDIHMATGQVVREYIRLLNKGGNAGKFQTVRFGNEKDFHSYRRKNKRYQITVYDKLYQMEDQKLVSCENPDGQILRVETAVLPEGIAFLKQHFGLYLSDLFWYELVEIFANSGTDLMCYILNKAILPGHYYTLAQAKRMIGNSRFSRSKQERIIDFLISLSRVPQIYRDTPCEKKRIRQLRELGINPASIEVRSGIKHLPPLQELIIQ